jgi:hypothetical protein
MSRQRALVESAAYQQGDPDAVAARYRIHFKPALKRAEHYEKLIATMNSGFLAQGKQGILKARAVEDRLMHETWELNGYDLMPKLASLRMPTLVMWGDYDFIPVSIPTHIAQAIPGSRLVTLPDHRTIGDFRKRHLTALQGFFEQVLRLAGELGTPRVGRVAVDGTKIKANASKHKAMSYGRMTEKQRQLRDEVRQLLAQADAADAAEDAAYGADHQGDELPAELQRRESRLARIREAKKALEARAKAEAAAAGEPPDTAKPDAKSQYNFTDPESRIMKGPDGFVQAYNAQVAVDALQLIVGQAVTQQTNDKQQLMPMIRTIEQQSGARPTQLLADAGYCSDENLTAIADTMIDAYISTRKQRHGERPGPCPRGPLPSTATRIDRVARKLLTKTGAAVYARRKSDRRTGDRADQTRARLPILSAARPDPGTSGMVARVHDAQHFEAVSPLRIIGGRTRVAGARPGSMAAHGGLASRSGSAADYASHGPER